MFRLTTRNTRYTVRSTPSLLSPNKPIVPFRLSYPAFSSVSGPISKVNYVWGEEQEDDVLELLRSPTFKLSYDDILQAHRQIKDTINETPCTFSPRLSQRAKVKLHLKKEHSLFTGSYKQRGVLNRLLNLTPEQKSKGVVCASTGNHGLALAYHATQLGINSLTVVAEAIYPTQVEQTKEYGGKILLHGETYIEALEKAREIAQTEGRILIPAHNDLLVAAGHGTVGLEIIHSNPYVDVVVAPVGGSLLCSIALAIKTINPRIKVYGVEAESSPTLTNAINSNITSVASSSTSDSKPGSYLPLEIFKKYVDGVLRVSEMERAYAIMTLLELEKTVVQGSGVAALAAVMRNDSDFSKMFDGKEVAIVCSGSNIDSTLLARVIEKGLVSDGRLARIRITVEDRHGQLHSILQIIANFRANVRDVHHERAFLYTENVGYTQSIYTIETRGPEQIKEILDAIRQAGFTKATLETKDLVSKT